MRGPSSRPCLAQWVSSVGTALSPEVVTDAPWVYACVWTLAAPVGPPRPCLSIWFVALTARHPLYYWTPCTLRTASPTEVSKRPTYTINDIWAPHVYRDLHKRVRFSSRPSYWELVWLSLSFWVAGPRSAVKGRRSRALRLSWPDSKVLQIWLASKPSLISMEFIIIL